MALPELRMSFADQGALEQELASNLKHGRAFVRDAKGVDVLADCVLVIVHPADGAELALQGQAVFVSEAGALCGVGVELRPFETEVVAKLEAFVRGERISGVQETSREGGGQQAESAVTAGDGAEHVPEAQDATAEDAAGTDAAPETEAEATEEDDAGPTDQQQQPALHERMRKLNITQQQKIARGGELNDRVMLERLYGKAVWDGLLHNPKLTIPEVARIARKGTAPRPLIDLIVDNNAWIQAPMVRRALLGNPRVGSEAILKLLRITPKHELKVIYKTTAYSTQVREAARKVLDL